jgi:siroheme decarboxylase
MSDADLRKKRTHLAVLQQPLPFTEEPFELFAQQLDLSQEEVLELIRHYREEGTIRRVAGVLKHNRAGFTTNAMVAMEIPAEDCDEAGVQLSRFPFITHCYRRTAYPDWPYTMYAMVHARDQAEFREHLDKIKQAVACGSMIVLHSLKEFKKTAFRMESGK